MYRAYIRLVPTMAWTILGYASMWRYIGKGPFYPLNLHDAMNCQDSGWWINILMVGNLVNVDNMVSMLSGTLSLVRFCAAPLRDWLLIVT